MIMNGYTYLHDRQYIIGNPRAVTAGHPLILPPILRLRASW